MQRVDLRAQWPWLLLVAVVVALPLLGPRYWVFLATTAAINIVLMLSLGVVSGRAGMITLCQASFAAIGGWTVAWLQRSGLGLPFALELVLGGLAALPFGILLGLPALRLRGINLAVVTLAFASAMDILLARFSFPGVSAGQPVQRGELLAGEGLYFWFCAAIVVALIAALSWADRHRIGSAWLAVGHSERAAAALGLSVPRAKLSAFAVGAGIAGIAGGLAAGQLGLLSSTNFAPIGSLVLFAVGTMIGVRYPGGAIAAGLMAVLMPELLRRLGLPPDLADLIFAVGAIQALSSGSSIFDHQRQRAAMRQVAAEATTDTGEAFPVPPVARPVSDGPALDIRDLGVSYGQVRALDGVNLAVLPGSVTALIGPNGAGKTTLVDAVTGFRRGYGGSVLLNGQPLDSLNATERARAGLRRSFQQGRTIPELTVGQYLRLAAGRELPEGELRELLAFFNCPPPERLIALVPVGTRRLVEVAAAVAARPHVILLDEPAAGLAATESRVLGERIAAIPARFGCAVLLIEHDIELVRAAATSVVVLDFGRVIAAGEPAAVLSDPAVIVAYLGGATIEEAQAVAA